MIIASVCFGCNNNIHRTPYTIDAFQPYDRQRDCASLKREISYYHKKIVMKINEVESRTGKNITLGLTIPFTLGLTAFFMDSSKAETTELESYKMRLENLQLIALDKKCIITPVKFIGYSSKKDMQALKDERRQYIIDNMDKPVSEEDMDIIFNTK
jgi:hypothetical protein